MNTIFFKKKSYSNTAQKLIFLTILTIFGMFLNEKNVMNLEDYR